jgi:ornithine cyclodeaminase
MQVLVVGREEVRQLLRMDECMELMARTLMTLGRGEALNPLRWGMALPERAGVLGMMPAYLGDPPAMGIKVVSVMPHNHSAGYDSHQGAVLLFEPEYGCLLAMMEAGEITAIRTAAVSGVATRLLARAGAGDLAILGSGVQAASHLDAMLHARPIRRVRVWSKTPENARRFAEQAMIQCNRDIEVMATVREAVEGADIVCTATAAPEPILEGAWLSPGAHVNAVGSSVKYTRELDTAAVVRSRLYVDRRESTLNEAGDFLFPKKEAALTDDHIRGEIGDLLLGRVEGRRSEEDITLFKSLGLGVEDVASACHIYYKAREMGIGTWVEWAGKRQEHPT